MWWKYRLESIPKWWLCRRCEWNSLLFVCAARLAINRGRAMIATTPCVTPARRCRRRAHILCSSCATAECATFRTEFNGMPVCADVDFAKGNHPDVVPREVPISRIGAPSCCSGLNQVKHSRKQVDNVCCLSNILDVSSSIVVDEIIYPRISSPCKRIIGRTGTVCTSDMNLQRQCLSGWCVIDIQRSDGGRPCHGAPQP